MYLTTRIIGLSETVSGCSVERAVGVGPWPESRLSYKSRQRNPKLTIPRKIFLLISINNLLTAVTACNIRQL